MPEDYKATKSGKVNVKLPEVVGKGYGTFWRWKGRYRAVKGSRASKKSKTTALWYITNMMKYPDANTLVVRKTYRTLKDSCFTELKWAIHRLGVDAFWDIKESPLEMTYKPNSKGTMLLLRVQLIEYHDKYMRLGDIPSYAYENFMEMYDAYHALGGNGMITKMMHEIEELHLKKKEV